MSPPAPLPALGDEAVPIPALGDHAAPLPALGDHAVQVWRAAPGSFDESDAGMLDESERRRIDSLRRRDDRRRSLAAAALLRRVAGAHCDVAPSRLRVDRRCPDCDRRHGKPRIAGSDLHVSLAHSGDRVLLAVTRLAPVGVDVERIAATGDLDAVATSILDPREPLPRDPRLRCEATLRYWTRKEAAVKATGVGLREPLRRVVVSPHDHAARLVRWEALGPGDVCLVDVDAGDGYLAAVGVLAAGPIAVTVHDWAPTPNPNKRNEEPSW